MRPDSELLDSFAASRDQASLRELVGRHFDLVYSVALRQVGGDAHLAKDVAQVVFAALADRASRLAKRASLTGWLYRTTQFTAANLVRTERRRRAREREAQLMKDDESGGDAVDWSAVRPHLDQAMNSLGERDRDVLMLRFFERCTYAEVGQRFRISEDAARMRADRALTRVRAFLSRRGIQSSRAALALGLGSEISTAAPAGLAASVANAVTLPGTVASGLLGPILLMSTTFKTLAGAAALALIVAGVYGVRTLTPDRATYQVRSSGDVVPGSSASDVARTGSTETAKSAPITIADLLEQLRAADAMPTSEAKTARILEIHRIWAGLDLAAALDSASHRGEQGYSILEAVVRADPKGGWDWVLRLPRSFMENGFYTAEATRRAVASMAKNGDAVLASRLVEEMQPGFGAVFRTEAARELAGIWALSAPLEVATWLARITDPEESGMAAQALGKAVASNDLSELARIVAMLSERTGNLVLAGVTREWYARGETEKLAAFLRANPELSDSRHDAILRSLSLVVQRDDPDAALGLILSIRNEKDRDMSLGTAAAEVATTDPATSIKFIASIADPLAQLDRAFLVYGKWADSDAEAARANVTAHAPEKLRNAILSVADTLAADPAYVAAVAELNTRRNAQSDAKDDPLKENLAAAEIAATSGIRKRSLERAAVQKYVSERVSP